MKKPSSKIRDEISKLQEQLRQAEAREAERIGRVALKARLGELAIDEADLLTAFEELADRFQTPPGHRQSGASGTGSSRSPSRVVGVEPPSIETGEV
jgi:hypothetical protein